MYGIPDDFDASIFVGTTVSDVSFGPFSVTLGFDAGEQLWIHAEGALEHRGRDWLDQLTSPSEPLRLNTLAGKRVIATRVEDTSTLSLDFEDGQMLRIFDRSEKYESFNIGHGKKLWIV